MSKRPSTSASPPANGPAALWLAAIRPATLSAAVTPVLVGTAAAKAAGSFHPFVFAVTLAGALLIQIGTNLANDLFDFDRGADTSERLGPQRALQTGLIERRQIRGAMVLAFTAAAAAGLYLAVVGGWPIVVIGAISIAAGLAYTGGPWPYGYHGLGDVFVFVFFGPVAVIGTYYLQTHTTGTTAVLAALPVGLLVTAILVVNNLRDIATDARVNKRTLAVRIGDGATRLEYVLLIAGTYAIVPLFWLVQARAGALLPLLTLPVAVGLTRAVLAGTAGTELNVTLRRTAGLHLAFGVLLAVGLAL